MKLILRIFHCLYWNGTPAKKTKPPVSTAGTPVLKKPPANADSSFSNDASPPGYKIRWHL
jgi:hypothetical protein